MHISLKVHYSLALKFVCTSSSAISVAMSVCKLSGEGTYRIMLQRTKECTLTTKWVKIYYFT